MNKNGIAITLPMYSSISAISVDCICAKVHMVGLFWMTKEKCVGRNSKDYGFLGLQGRGDGFVALSFCKNVYFCTCESKRDRFTMKSKSKKNKKKQFSNLKSLLKADREKEIEQHGKQVSMRPSKVHKSKKDYDRKRNRAIEKDIDND